jgi:bifunctional non-homologous end joining protein LigD
VAPSPAPDRRASRLRRQLKRLGAPARAVTLEGLQPMLAEHADEPFSGPGWVFELKHDGFRLLAERKGSGVRLQYRSGAATPVFPEIERVLAAQSLDLVLDGEVVVLDAAGRPSFQGLQKRVQLRRAADIERAARRLPATVFAFDLLSLEGHDLRELPLLERKRLLREALPETGPLRYADHVEENGLAFYAEVRRMGLEGIVAKRADSRYVPGRSPQWLKVRVDRTAELAVVGFTLPRDSRSGFGALHLAAWDGGAFVYTGRVGSGFDERELERVRRELDGARLAAAPCRGPLPAGRAHVWVQPTLVCEVRYKEATEEGLLRQPVFLRFRPDKSPAQCAPLGSAAAPSTGPPLTNLAKVFWPREGYTKGDLVEYYRSVAPWLLPYLRDRPLVLTRYPDGIEGKSFFQKDAGTGVASFAQARLRTIGVWSDASRRTIDYFVCEDADALVYLANLGTIPLHLWPSRVGALDRPDWCILDLDPKGAPFAQVVTLALAVKRLCDELGLPCFPKTSGASGLHVLLPLGGQCSFEQSRSLGHLIGWTLTREHPRLATIDRPLRDRGGKVYVDYLQNAHGQLLVAPFSVRPLPGAPVSTPLEWKEVTEALDPSAFTIRTLLTRLRRQRQDPLLPVLSERPDLLSALSTLQGRLPDKAPGQR